MGERDAKHLRALPSIDFIMRRLEGSAPRSVLKAAARRAVDEARVATDEHAVSSEAVLKRTGQLLEDYARGGLQPVINATGVLLHTNLGRSPLGTRQLDAVVRAAKSYGNLEYDLTAGARGDRLEHIRRLLTDLTGAEDALVANNNAGATLLVLASVCHDREVIVSRGELVEIGGAFRIPDIVSTAGVKLREVGTTNRTRIGDYERAITPETAAILKVHPSNYRVVGFAEDVAARDLARLARARGIPFIHDIGSGLMQRVEEHDWLGAEPGVVESLREGADAVLFSGDKLLGGPQAGIVVGRRALVERALKHPLARALRPDKMTLAALEQTLVAYAEHDLSSLPLWALAGVSEAELLRRAEGIRDEVVARVPSAKVAAERTEAATGGGSLPGAAVPSAAVVLEVEDPDAFTENLRRAEVPVIARIADGRVLLDLRAVFEEQDQSIVDAVCKGLEVTGR